MTTSLPGIDAKLDQVLEQLRDREVVFPVAPHQGMSWRFDCSGLWPGGDRPLMEISVESQHLLRVAWTWEGYRLSYLNQPYRVERPEWAR